MSTWRDQLGPASFRGAGFFVDTSEHSGGRRTVVHEYPFRDQPFAEDMGRAARSFQVDAYVFGDDYLSAKNALIAALEKSGPGELSHPYFGTRQVALTAPFRVRESSAEGGIAKISMEFVETTATDNAVTAPQVDAAGSVRASCVNTRAATQTNFLSSFVAGPFMDSVIGGIQTASTQIAGLLNAVNLVEQDQATLVNRLQALRDNAEELIGAPGDLYLSMVGVFELVDSLPFLLQAYAVDFGTRPPANTENRAQEQACFDALTFMTRRLAAVRAAEVLPDQTFDSYDDAVTQRNTVADLLDDQTEVASDDVYPALLQLRADIVKAVPGLNSDLPHLVVYTPPVTVPSLVLAHRLYGSVALELDLVARNHIRHPGFVGGGLPLEVLSDG